MHHGQSSYVSVIMSKTSNIEWTDRTWNPVTGCTEVSSGCDNCYARILANRLLKDIYTQAPLAHRREDSADPFAVRLWPNRLEEPRKWKDNSYVFVNSMGDLFHHSVPEKYVREVFKVMIEANKHTYQVLTKRPGRMAKFILKNIDLFQDDCVPNHIWMGTSVESQEVAYRVEHLREVKAKVHFLSCEPLIGPLDLDLDDIEWVIVGGESGIVHRPLDTDWVRNIRDACIHQQVPFFFKQIGGRTPKANGRLLDGRLWDEMPFRSQLS